MMRWLAAVAALAAAVVPIPVALATSAPTFSVQNSGAPETLTYAAVPIVKSAVASSYSKLQVTTVDGTAKAGVDYKPLNVTITVANSQLIASVQVPMISRLGYQGNRSFTVHVRAVRNAVVTVSDATVTVIETDPQPTTTWTKCADEGQTCWVSGTANVRYGSGSTWVTQQATNSIICSNAVFGDPTPGVFKGCYTDGTVGSPPPPPVISPSPSYGSWVSAPLTVGGFACSKVQAAAPKSGPCGARIIYRIISVGMSADAIPVPMYAMQFYQDASGNFPVSSAYETTVVSYWPGSDLIGIAPSVSVS